MYSMLIVDDEEITRNGLRSLPLWPTLGIRVTGCAQNGEEALAALEKLPIHILLTDVKMPCMDGLLLAEHVRQQYPQIRIVFVSGYDDVSYIRRALRMSAVDYILKPVDPNELKQCFTRVVHSLNHEQDRKDELEKLLNAYQVGMTFMQENLLNILLTSDSISEAQLRQAAQALCSRHGEQYYWVAVVHAQGDMHTMLRVEEGRYCFPIDLHQGIFALLFSNTTSVSLTSRHSALSTLRDQLRAQGMRRFFAIYSERTGSVWEIRPMYKQALAALPSCFACPDGSILSYEDARQHTGVRPQIPEITADRLEHLFFTAGEAEAKSALTNWFNRLRSANLTCAADYIPLFSPLLRGLDDVLHKRFTVQEDDGMDFSQQLGMLVNAFCLDDMFDIVQRHYLGIRSMLIDQATGETSARVAKVKHYVRKHYAEPITIDTLAREVNLAPTYLCLLFREEVGQTLNAYLTSVRMEQARLLLADETLKLYDVSLAVGYPNASYFTRQFRKYTGMTPTEYRNRSIKEE